MTAERDDHADPSTTNGGGAQAPSAGQPEDRAQAAEPRRGRRRRWLFRLISVVVVPAFLLAAIELCLRIFDFGYDTSFAVRTQVDGQTVYVPNFDFPRRFFPRGLGRSPTPFVIPASKPQNGYRVFVFGGSAAAGFPDPAFSFSRILEVELRERFFATQFEVINCAATAINSHVVLEAARDCAELQPDLFVVYLGNNEVVGPFGAGTVLAPFSSNLFTIRAGLALRSTRVGQLIGKLVEMSSRSASSHRWEGMRAFLRQQVPADAPALQSVYQHLEANLSDLCDVAARSEIPVILCTMATNLKDCPPFASLHRSDLTEPERARWNALYQEGVVFESDAHYRQAAERYLAAASIDDQYADLHYRLGRCYWLAGEFPPAGEHFAMARQLDALRFRVDARINDIIRTIASARRGRGVYLADAERVFQEASPHLTPGEELFLEHVHLNFAGNVLLAQVILEQIERLLPERVTQHAAPRRVPLDEVECAVRLGFTDWERSQITRKLLDSLISQPPFTNQLYHIEHVNRLEKQLATYETLTTPERRQEIDAQYRAAISANSADAWLRVKYAIFLLSTSGDLATIDEQLDACMQSQTLHAGALHELAVALVERGKYTRAAPFFQHALRLAPTSVKIHASLAGALVQQQRLAEAVQVFEQAVRLDPENPDLHHKIGFAFELRGELDQAIEHYQRALQLDPARTDDYYSLSRALAVQGRTGEIIDLLRQAVEARPNDVSTHRGLAAALKSHGILNNAGRRFRTEAQTDPQAADAHYCMGLVMKITGPIEQALFHLREAARLNPEWPAPLIHLAETLATHPCQAIRNGAEAVELAERSCRATGYEDPYALDVLAAAYAEVGRFPDAIRTVQKAITIATPNKPGLLDRLAQRLELYQADEPYHAAPSAFP